MEYGLIGEHLPHSFSKEIHEKFGFYTYELHEVARDEIDSFMQEKNFTCINVTIPYKQTVIPYLDEISERAKSIGAVNTITNRNGRLCGDNTDFGGMRLLIEKKMGLDLSGKKVVILGTGGTSKTALAVAQALGAKEILRVSRSSSENAISYDELYEKHSDADFLINATPCGMFPNTDPSPVSLDSFTRLEGVIDVIYNPIRTRLVRDAQKKGIPAEGGLYMLVGQAVLAAEIFLNQLLPADAIDEIYEEILSSKLNIVLTGMPGGGKSTIGKAIQAISGRELIDTDAEIVRRAGKPITEIFAEQGEPYFRDLESEVIRDVAKKTGCIISTGGGVPLRQENMDALRMNGTVFFLDRPPQELLPSDDRPLSNTDEKLKALYETRYPIYTSTADYTFPIESTPENAAEIILELMK